MWNMGSARNRWYNSWRTSMLVMGDNRNNSNDGRFWGLLSVDRVIGKATEIGMPINRAREIR